MPTLNLSVKIPEGHECYITEPCSKKEAPWGGFKEIECCPFLNHARRILVVPSQKDSFYPYCSEKISAYCEHFKKEIQDNCKCDDCLCL